MNRTADLIAEPFEDEDRLLDFEDTELYDRWRRRVKEGKPNDFIICVTASSHTGVSGTGKTTAEVGLCKEFDLTDSGFSAEENATLDSGELAYEILPNIESGSAVCFDEAQGAPATDSVNARRGMKQEAIDAINAILANRDMRITLVITAQQLSMLDSSLYPLIDAWLLIRYEPDDPRGPLMTHHKLHVNDYDLKNPSLKTPGVEDLTWPEIPMDDPDYRVLEAKKQDAKQRGGSTEDEDKSLDKETQMQIAQEFRDAGKSLQWIADNVDSVEYSRETIRKETIAEGDS
ncbi:MAG: hypothetical protein ABEI98_02540 [Halorhabdus sp.]